MRIFPQLRLLAIGLVLAIGIPLPGRADTHLQEFTIPANTHCSCACEASPKGHMGACGRLQCDCGMPGDACQHIAQSPQAGPFDHPTQSRPAYSRKSNRIQRAQL